MRIDTLTYYPELLWGVGAGQDGVPAEARHGQLRVSLLVFCRHEV